MPATTNKQQILATTLTALKKKFPPPPEPPRRPIMEEVVYAICREGVPSAAADAAFGRIKATFFDWNEVRVSTVQEVADALGKLPGAGDRAKRIVEFLQEHFERTYSFDLEDLEKKGLKQAAKQLARYKDKGVTDFVVAWVTQRSLGGHAVPLDGPSLRVLSRLGVADADADDLEAVRASRRALHPEGQGVRVHRGADPARRRDLRRGDAAVPAVSAQVRLPDRAGAARQGQGQGRQAQAEVAVGPKPLFLPPPKGGGNKSGNLYRSCRLVRSRRSSRRPDPLARPACAGRKVEAGHFWPDRVARPRPPP